MRALFRGDQICLSLQEYLQMPRDSIRTLVMSAEKDAVKRFISRVHQSWDQLQVETDKVPPKVPQGAWVKIYVWS